MDQESVVLEVDPRSVHNAIVQANKDVESWEKGIVGAGDRMQKSLERMADLLIKVNDKQRSSLERLTQSIEKQAAAYGKTGVDRLVAERDRLIKKLGDEEGMINRVRAAYEQMIAAEKGGSGTGGIGGTGLNARYLFFGAKDLMEGRTKFAIAEAANEMMRLEGTALAVGGAVAGVAALGFATYEVVKGLREIREEPEKVGAAFAKLEDPLRAQGDELRATNARLEETIAKLRQEPANPLKAALYDARIEADKLAESLTKDLDKVTELLEKNRVSTWHKILGEAGTTDVKNVVQQLSKSQDMLMAQFSEAMAKTKTPKEVEALQADFVQRLKNLYEGAQKDLQQRQQMEPGIAWVRTIVGTLAGGAPNLVYQDDATRQRTLKETSATLNELLGQAQARIEGAGLKPEKDRLEALHDQVKKAEEERKKFQTEAASFVKRGDESELDAIGKIYYERDQLLKQAEKLKGVEAEIAAIRKSADEQASAVMKKSWDEFEKYDREHRAKQSNQMLGLFVPSKQQVKEWEEMFQAQERVQDIGVEAQREVLRRHAAMEAKSAATPEDAYRIRVDLAVKLAGIEVARIDREDNAARRMVLAAQAQRDLYTELAQAQDELDEKRAAAEQKRAEELQRQVDEIQKVSSGLFHTLFTQPQDFGKQLRDTIREALLKPVTEGLGGMVAGALHPFIYGADGQGGIAGMFRGIFGGKQDPVKAATDLNTAATAQNSAAVAMLTAVLAGFMGIGAPAIAAPGIPGIGGISLPAISAPISTAPSAPIPSFSPAEVALAASGGYSPASWSSAGSILGGYSPAPWSAAGGMNPLAAILRGSPASATSGGKSGVYSLFTKEGFSKTLSNLKSSVWNEDAWNAYPSTTGGYLAGGIQGVATSPAAGAAGLMLAESGLLGGNRGTWGGALEGAAGGALIGNQIAGPLGAAAGASFGFEIGAFEKLFGVESPENEAKRLVKQLYSISIDTQMAKQIVGIAQQKYAGHVSIAVRDPDVRQMLMLYSQGTGQKMPLSAATPQSASLAEMGGKLYQQATYVNGTPYTFQSNLPVLGGYATGTYPNPGPMMLQVNVQGQGAAQFVAGQVVTPEFVQAQWSSAAAGSNGRLQNSAVIQQPGLVIS